MVTRWTLYDPDLDETYVFVRNPNKMTTPHASRTLTVLATTPRNAGNVHGLVVEANADAADWTFSGDIRTRDHYEQLLSWSRKLNRLQLTDHLGRTWSIRMVQFNPTEQRPTKAHAWRFTYEMKTLNYGLLA